jgi:hypothetical protein
VGPLTNYFVARNDEDATRAHTTIGGPKWAGFETAEWKSVDPVVTLAMLDQVVTGRDALAWIKAGFPDSTVAGSETDEHWVFRVYDHHRAVLDGIADDQIEDTARRWGATDELNGWDPKDVRAILKDLVRLARSPRCLRTGPVLLGFAVTMIEHMI